MKLPGHITTRPDGTAIVCPQCDPVSRTRAALDAQGVDVACQYCWTHRNFRFVPKIPVKVKRDTWWKYNEAKRERQMLLALPPGEIS